MGIGVVFTAFAIASTIFRHCPQSLKFVALSILGGVVLLCLTISHYVIVRYPYLSLVEPEDGDMFSRHFPSAGSVLYVILKGVGMLIPLSLLIGCWVTGFQNVASKVMFAYCVLLFLFMVHFTFFYDRLKHPTITTFIRSTLGLGIPLYPFYALTIAIGAWRCRRLLDNVSEDF